MLSCCIAELQSWCSSRRLQLTKNLFDLVRLTRNTTTPVHRWPLDPVIQPVDDVEDLGVLLDRELTMKQHVNLVLLPSPTTEATRTTCQSSRTENVYDSHHPEQVGLLQFHPGPTSSVNLSPAAACCPVKFPLFLSETILNLPHWAIWFIIRTLETTRTVRGLKTESYLIS